MFIYESSMTQFAEKWLVSQGMMTKREFETPWGICDLVGCVLDKSKILKRLEYGQTKSVGSQLRMMILNLIPDVEKEEDISLCYLKNYFSEFFTDERIQQEILRLKRDKFIIETPQNSLQKLNGWMPLQKKIVALELKLNRVNEALHQAINNLEFADFSYTGFPLEIAKKIVDDKKKKDFAKYGIGILGINFKECKVLLEPDSVKSNPDKTTQAYCVERFWKCFKGIAS